MAESETKMNVITNNVPRDIIEGYELSEKERAEFDYLNWDDIDKGNDSASFFRYKGQLYDLGDFADGTSIPGWDSAQSDTFFSGICIRMIWDTDSSEYRILVGRYYS